MKVRTVGALLNVGYGKQLLCLPDNHRLRQLRNDTHQVMLGGPVFTGASYTLMQTSGPYDTLGQIVTRTAGMIICWWLACIWTYVALIDYARFISEFRKLPDSPFPLHGRIWSGVQDLCWVLGDPDYTGKWWRLQAVVFAPIEGLNPGYEGHRGIIARRRQSYLKARGSRRPKRRLMMHL